ncbi:MAG: hypothetical protein RBT11_17875 [Desulfobacterales bacterium]|jgi:hypothetical protein|nr:hypothetical protein [Desulfobacterales bacterium]
MKVSQQTIAKLEDFLKDLPSEVWAKCSICNETLVHWAKKAEAETGAGTATVSKAIADKVNSDAAPGDKISSEALRQRIIGKTTDKNLSVRYEQIKSKPATWRCTICNREYPATTETCPDCDGSNGIVSYAMDFAASAISQLKRIEKSDPNREAAFLKVEAYIAKMRAE